MKDSELWFHLIIMRTKKHIKMCNMLFHEKSLLKSSSVCLSVWQTHTYIQIPLWMSPVSAGENVGIGSQSLITIHRSDHKYTHPVRCQSCAQPFYFIISADTGIYYVNSASMQVVSHPRNYGMVFLFVENWNVVGSLTVTAYHKPAKEIHSLSTI